MKSTRILFYLYGSWILRAIVDPMQEVVEETMESQKNSENLAEFLVGEAQAKDLGDTAN